VDEIRIVPLARKKLQSLHEALQEALTRGTISEEEFEQAVKLIRQLMATGLTPYINKELGTLIAKIELVLEVEESPEWSEALIACDRAYLGEELKEMCLEHDLSTHGHKKLLCNKLYNAGEERVVSVMQPYLTQGRL